MTRVAKQEFGNDGWLSKHVFSPSIYLITTTLGSFQGRIPHVR